MSATQAIVGLLYPALAALYALVVHVLRNDTRHVQERAGLNLIGLWLASLAFGVFSLIVAVRIGEWNAPAIVGLMLAGAPIYAMLLAHVGKRSSMVAVRTAAPLLVVAFGANLAYYAFAHVSLHDYVEIAPAAFLIILVALYLAVRQGYAKAFNALCAVGIVANVAVGIPMAFGLFLGLMMGLANAPTAEQWELFPYTAVLLLVLLLPSILIVRSFLRVRQGGDPVRAATWIMMPLAAICLFMIVGLR